MWWRLAHSEHRNGPLLLEDQTANLNDFYIFRSYETGKSNNLVMSMSVQGFQNPDQGPSYYKFSDSVAYRFNINNQRGLDGNPDIEIDFVFNTQLRSNATFDYLNFRAPAPVLTGSADSGPGAAYPNAVDGFAGYNISLIAVEMPITMATANGAMPTAASDPNAHIGAWASTLRQIVTIRPSPSDPQNYGEYVQVDRVGNPLTVEALIPCP